MDLGLLEEFRFDWELAGKAGRTVDDYIAALRLLFAESSDPDLAVVKGWVASTSYASVRRKRARPSPHGERLDVRYSPSPPDVVPRFHHDQVLPPE